MADKPMTQFDQAALDRLRQENARAERLKIKMRRDPDIRDLQTQLDNLREENRILRERLNTLDGSTADEAPAAFPRKRGRPPIV